MNPPSLKLTSITQTITKLLSQRPLRSCSKVISNGVNLMAPTAHQNQRDIFNSRGWFQNASSMTILQPSQVRMNIQAPQKPLVLIMRTMIRSSKMDKAISHLQSKVIQFKSVENSGMNPSQLRHCSMKIISIPPKSIKSMIMLLMTNKQ